MIRNLRALVVLLYSLALASSGAPAADQSSAPDGRDRQHATLFSQLEKVDVVEEGAKPPKSVLYVFFDANCFYCQLTWKALQPYEAVGLQVRWVPVAYQQPSSVTRAAAIMLATDRVAALRINETGYNANRFDGGIKPVEQVSDSWVAQFQANTKLMQSFGVPGTPALVWKDRAGRVRIKVGVPRLSELPQMTGLPAQVNDDPELKEFR